MTALVKKPNYVRVKDEVRKVLRRFDIEEPPVDPVTIARGLGVEVEFVTFKKDFDTISGFYDAEEHVIYVNSNEYPLRQTFTIAHELGHSILHREWAKSENYQILMRDPEANNNNCYEKEANAFAAHLLVPRNFLDRYIDILDSKPRKLSELFAVSVPMIKNRIAFEYGE